ncbi:MAG TPA: EscU/YscU/HrcU family type III secretion system export apparatus switch protein [Bryobacteraceae bacterium]|nr:EscU/YscU/HrcU family type III secretion system export apparatus switch protein [Bryobacteraceae bacterium]
MPGERTEKPTPRKVEKARREGNFAVSRDIIGAGQFLLFVFLLSLWSAHLLAALTNAMSRAFRFTSAPQVDPASVVSVLRTMALHIGLPVISAGALLVLFSVALQLGVTRFGFALNKLAPDLTRLDPLRRLKSLPAQNIPALLQSVVLMPLCFAVVWQIARHGLDSLVALEFVPVATGFRVIASHVDGLLWKAALILLVLGVADLIRQKRSWTKQLMMTKQEIREEAKETEGNPQMKMRVRRIQRDLARRHMMREVPKATAVIVNPTHYAVAIRYELGSMAAPKVVAKGRNYLALRIRQIALEHQVPIVENKPLAQGLYKSVEVGQEIPAHLYKAVAEVLAYIYRLMNPRGRPV